MKTEARTLAAALLGALLGATPLARAADATPSPAVEPQPPSANAATPPPANAPTPPPAEGAPPAATASPASTPPPPAPTPAAAPVVAPAPAPPVAASSTNTSKSTEHDEASEHDDGLMGSHQLHSYAQLGLRSSLVTDDGLDPFSTDNVVNHFSVTLGRVLVTQDDLSFGLGAGWDYSHDGASVRSTPTSLNVHRLTLVPEARYHFARRLYGFARIGAGIGLLDATLERGGEQSSSANNVAFTADGSAGIAWEAIGERKGDSRQPRMWLIADAGYLFTSKADLTLDTAPGAPARADGTSLGEVGLSGFTYRVTAALTY
jgi:hypothetical protein